VLRNYENLFEDNSSDIDLAVQPEDVRGLQAGLAEAAAATGHRLVQRARYINYSHVYWHSEGGFVRVDFDTEFRWRIFPVLTAKSVITLRRKAGAFYIPHPRHESAILWLAAIERGELSARYRQQLGRLYEQLVRPEELRRTFRAAFGEHGEDLASCQKQAASPVSEVQNSMATGPDSALWRRVRRSIVGNSFRGGPSRRLLWKFFRKDLGRLCERAGSPAGMSMLYASASPAQKGLEDFLERTDVLFPTNKLVVSETGSSGGARGPNWERLRVLFKGGLFIRSLRVERDADLQKSLRRRVRFLFPARDLVWVESSDGRTFLAHSSSGFMAEVKPGVDARAFSGQIIEFISSILEPRPGPRVARKRGAFVVLVGLDGSGKTTVAREICCQAAASERFHRIRYFHWRPAVFGPAALPLPEFRNVPRKPRLTSNPVRSLLSIARLLKNLVLSNVAHWVRVAPMLRRGGLVLVDRYYYNYYLDPVSVRYYGPSWLLDRLCPFFPRPDLVVALRAPAEVLLSRKQELSAEEISRQNALLNRVPFGADQVLELDASRPAGETACEILRKLGEVSS